MSFSSLIFSSWSYDYCWKTSLNKSYKHSSFYISCQYTLYLSYLLLSVLCLRLVTLIYFTHFGYQVPGLLIITGVGPQISGLNSFTAILCQRLFTAQFYPLKSPAHRPSLALHFAATSASKLSLCHQFWFIFRLPLWIRTSTSQGCIQLNGIYGSCHEKMWEVVRRMSQ